MPFSLFIRSVTAVLMIAPAGVLMGHLFPQGLAAIKEKGNALVPWAWAVNGASSAIASALAPLLAQIMGFEWVILAGAICYAIILFLPDFS